MKKLLLVPVAALLLFSCKQSPSPNETARAFIEAVYQADLTTASDLASTSTRAVLDKAKKETSTTLSAEEAFNLSAMAETVNEKKAEVKNDILTLSLVKEDGWKVELTEALLSQIQNREKSLATMKAKWEALLKEYNGRMTVAREYINYRKGLGALSAKATALSNLLDASAAPATWTRQSVLAFVQQQQQLNGAIDAALEPSQAANTDLTMNYFLQLSHAADRIKLAEGAYQLVAEKAMSPVFVPLPFKAASTIQVNSN